jgi:uncharacterized protein
LIPNVGSIRSIYRYPVKSMAGESVRSSYLTGAGLDFDRLYAFESSGAPAGMLRLSGRERRQMLRYQPTSHSDGSVEVLVPTGERFPVDSPALLEYLRAHLGENNHFALTRESIPQTDVRPLSLISMQTVHHLSVELGQRIDPRRFRANLYLDLSDGPFTEDDLQGRTLRVGSKATILIRERDPRCRVVTYDPEDPVQAPPLFDLMKLLDREHQGRAGAYATIRTPGPIHVGDPICLEDDDFDLESQKRRLTGDLIQWEQS